MRLDKFLKVSRLIKRRTVANEACDAGRVTINGKPAKASAAVKEGDILEIGFGTKAVKVEVLNVQETVKKDAEKALKAFTDVVTEELKKGEKIQLVGFGTFEVSERAAREGRNPQSGEPMKIEASKAPRFKAGKALKDMINEK